MKKVIFPLLGILLGTFSCVNDQDASDAFGNFEAVSVMVAAESQGRIISLDVEEGQRLSVNKAVGTIDSMQIHLKKEQLYAAINTVDTKSATINAQIASIEVQRNNLEKEYERVLSLLKDGAATEKQKDDLEGNLELLKSQKISLSTQKNTIRAEKKSLLIQIDQVNDQIRRSIIKNPVDGIVLQKYKQEGEIIGPGQPIYKIANIDNLILRAYISGNQLSQVKIGQKLTVRIDSGDGIGELEGNVNWISSQAEFTPKIIQTREERVNLVYAIKVEVKNDGRLKIGMPGEIKF